MAELPPDPGKLLQVDAPYVDVNAPAGQVEEARRALAGAGDDFFAKQQAENSLAYAQNRLGEATFGQKRYEEQRAYVETRNQEVLARDANRNGEPDRQEREDARTRALLTAPVGLATAALVVSGASSLMMTGVAPASLPLMGAFAALATVAPKLNESVQAKDGPTQGFSLAAPKGASQKPITLAQMGPAAMFGGRAADLPDLVVAKPAVETGLDQAPGADVVAPVRARPVQMAVTPRPTPPTWARTGGGMNA